MERNFAGSGGKGGMRGFNVQTQHRYGTTAKPARNGVLKSIGVGVQLATVERDLGGFGLGGLEVHHTIGAIVEIKNCVQLTSQKAGQGMVGENNWKRLDPLLGDTHIPGGQGRVNIGGGTTSELGFHQTIDSTKYGRKWGSRAVDATEVFKVETARALVPQESQVRWAEFDECGGHRLPIF